MFVRNFRIYFFLLLIAGVQISKVEGQERGAALLERLASSPEMSGGQLAFCLIDIETGEEMLSWASNQIMVPASNLKLLTTATALGILGPNFRFETKLAYSGRIEKGILYGNLHIIGGGDPTFGGERTSGSMDASTWMDEWHIKIVEAGIGEIKGDIIAEDYLIDGRDGMRSWSWEDLGSYYAAGARALNYHENYYEIQFQQQEKIGSNPPVSNILPAIPDLHLINEVKTAGPNTGDNAWIFGGPGQMERYIRGSIPAGRQTFTIKGSIPDPPLLLANTFKNRLIECGLQVRGEVIVNRKAENTADLHYLYIHYSPPLEELIKIINFESHNLYAESLFLALSLDEQNTATFVSSAQKLIHFWKGLGLDHLSTLQLKDGSGLSPRNGISAKQLASILYISAVNPDIFPDFKNTIPLCGMAGTVKNLLKGSDAEGFVSAKSGSLDRVIGYSGYLTNKKGKKFAFSYIVNNYSGSASYFRKGFEELMITLFNH